jgi:hypothetical protein
MVAEIRTYCVTIRRTGHVFCRLLVAIERDEPNCNDYYLWIFEIL